jgi:hypothetical protein
VRIAVAVVRWGALDLAAGRSSDNSANAKSAKASAPQATTR